MLCVAFFSNVGFRSFPNVANAMKYPCTSNINISCTYFVGQNNNYNQVYLWDKIVMTFGDSSYGTTNFHALIPDTSITTGTHYYFYQIGVYNQLTFDYKFYYASNTILRNTNWVSSPLYAYTTLSADMSGKAGAYRTNVSVNVNLNYTYNTKPTYLVLATQWSFF